ncbi:MAG: hypothetical protein H6736_18380 [Alphaproteobacteria bacterium]|nr:hypothetical protein [Alphaproteobacteria bacterium]
MIGILRSVVGTPFANVDLLAVFALSLLLVPLVPTGNPLARPDLAPWATLVMVIAAQLRARTLGDRPPPSLTARQWSLGRWLLRISRATGPITLLLWFDAASMLSLPRLYAAVGASIVTLILRRIGRRDGTTAWRPRGQRATRAWFVRAVATVLVTVLAGLGTRVLRGNALVWLPVSAYVGVLFVSIGLLEDRLQTLAQRRAAGRRDGRPHRPPRHRYLLAAFGPSLGLLLLLWLHEALIAPVGFEQAPVVTLHILAWIGILFPQPTPIAVSCLLHEVVPIGGRDPGAKPGRVVPFDEPPRGALRIDPIAVKRLRVLHHWVVPVRDPRIEVLDDPTRPLWPRQPTPLAHNVLGDSAFEPDRLTGQPQRDAITIRLRNQVDVGQLHELNAQQRRLAVLRPFSGWWASLRRQGRTYRWDKRLPADALRVVDASTQVLELRDGDILVLSTEGVARAYELEIGAPIFDHDVFGRQRPAQLEDYVAGGG